MQRYIQEEAGRLIVTRCWCGIQYAIPETFHNMLKRQHEDGKKQGNVYCPVGHTWVFTGEGEAVKLRRQLVAKEATCDRLRAEVKHKEDQRRAEKAAKTRIKNRVMAGVCPCCNRTFQDLARHMKTKHSGYTKEDRCSASR